MNNRLTLTGANKLFLLFTAVFLVYQVVISFVFGTAIYDHMYTVVLINEAMIAGFVIVYCLVKKINIKETFRFNKLGILPALIIIAAALPAMLSATMFNTIVVYLLQFIGNIPAQGIPVPSSVGELMIGILIIGVAPGVCEELMHRGFLLKAYERRGSYRAVVIVSIFFGLFHFDITNLFGPIFLGLIIGYYVVRTDSIFAGILAHFLNNSIAELVQFFSSDKARPEYITVSGEELISIIAVGIPALVITIGLLFLYKKVTTGKSVIIPPISSKRQDLKTVISHWPVIVVVVLYILFALLTIFSYAMMKSLGF